MKPWILVVLVGCSSGSTDTKLADFAQFERTTAMDAMRLRGALEVAQPTGDSPAQILAALDTGILTNSETPFLVTGQGQRCSDTWYAATKKLHAQAAPVLTAGDKAAAFATARKAIGGTLCELAAAAATCNTAFKTAKIRVPPSFEMLATPGCAL